MMEREGASAIYSNGGTPVGFLEGARVQLSTITNDPRKPQHTFPRGKQAALHDVTKYVVPYPERQRGIRPQGFFLEHVAAALGMDVNETEGGRGLIDDKPQLTAIADTHWFTHKRTPEHVMLGRRHPGI
jgi:hypothetical protein